MSGKILETHFDKNSQVLYFSLSQYNGIAFWAEWTFDSGGNTVISTGPTAIPKIGEVIKWDMNMKQGVHFLQPKFETEMKCEFTLNVEDGTYNINFS